MTTSLLEKALLDPKFRKAFAEESFVLETLEAICSWMYSKGIEMEDRELAKKLGVDQKEVARFFTGPEDLTLRQVAAVVHALGARIQITLEVLPK